MNDEEISAMFPIVSQTTLNDKRFIMSSIDFMKRFKQQYSYVEIGSYLGGSLTPFLKDDNCHFVLSIDDREQLQPDERGAKFDYAGVTHATMIDQLHEFGIKTEKLRTYDGSVDTVNHTLQAFDLAFIDGEHTDYACIRDFFWVLPMMRSDALVMFHDSSLVFKGIRICQLYLRKLGVPFKFVKKSGSEMSMILLGSYMEADISDIFGAEDDLEAFYASSETSLIQNLIANRVEVQFSLKVNPAKSFAAFVPSDLRKNISPD